MRCALLAIVALLAATGCSAQATRTVSDQGVVYGEMSVPFRGRWYQYDERALVFARHQAWAAAERDLRIALRLRGRERRMARTWGMHFTCYFAHRELAAVLIAQGRLDEAESELRISLTQEPSAKAVALLERITGLRAGDHLHAPPAPQVIGIDDGHFRPETPEAAAATPGALTLEVVAPAAPVAGIAQLHIEGHCSGAADGLVAIAPGRAQQAISVAPDRTFSADLPSDATLMAAALVSYPEQGPVVPPAVPIALPQADIFAIDGPPASHPLPGTTAWFSITAASAGGLRGLVIEEGGERVSAQSLSGQRFAGMVAVSRPPGSHALRFRLQLASGAELQRNATVELRPAPARDLRLRARAQLLPATASGPGTLPDQADDMRCEEALLREHRFRYERADVQVAALEETTMWRAGWFSQRTLSRVTDEQARYLIAVIITREADGIECYLTLIHRDSRVAFAHLDGYASATDERTCGQLFAALANRLGCDFPVLDGRCLTAQGTAQLALGTLDGVRRGVRLSVLTPNDSDHTVAAIVEAGAPEDHIAPLSVVSGRLTDQVDAVGE